MRTTEQINAARRTRYAADPERDRAWSHSWQAANPGYSSAKAKEWRAKNKESAKLYFKGYQAAHPDLIKLWDKTKRHKRRAQKEKVVIIPFSPPELVTHIEETGGRCVYCGGPYEDLDHVYPLSKGGPHALNNLAPCCKPCNGKKHNKLPLQWLLGEI